MRKTSETARFPQSVQLFKFCLRVLELRRPTEKIHDQDLGGILKYNPSDTSHWKRGKKAIRNVQTLEILAAELDVDLEILQDLSDGFVDLDEAWSDFCDSEEEKRLLAEPAEVRISRRDRAIELEKVAQEILAQANISAMPVYIPELINHLPFIQLVPGDVTEKLARSVRIKPGQYSIRYRKGDLRAHTRCAIAREVARIILFSERERLHIQPKSENLAYAEIIDMANSILVPRDYLATEIQKISTRTNMVKALADIFWVPKSVIRSRLSSILLETAATQVFHAETIAGRPMNVVKTEFEDLSEDGFAATDTASLAFASKKVSSLRATAVN